VLFISILLSSSINTYLWAALLAHLFWTMCNATLTYKQIYASLHLALIFAKKVWAKIKPELLLFQEAEIVQILLGNINRRTKEILTYILPYLIFALSLIYLLEVRCDSFSWGWYCRTVIYTCYNIRRETIQGYHLHVWKGIWFLNSGVWTV
jgi:hypothetical protein